MHFESLSQIAMSLEAQNMTDSCFAADFKRYYQSLSMSNLPLEASSLFSTEWLASVCAKDLATSFKHPAPTTHVREWKGPWVQTIIQNSEDLIRGRLEKAAQQAIATFCERCVIMYAAHFKHQTRRQQLPRLTRSGGRVPKTACFLN